MPALSTGFPPIARNDARILILGTLPGTQSLKHQQYYAHPQNHFWKIMAAFTGADPQSAYARRVQALIDAGIALWDVCAAAERRGSLDSAIKSPTPNDFPPFFAAHPQLACIAFNGRSAEKLFARYASPHLNTAPPSVSMPSTSPAYAAVSFATKQHHWHRALQTALSAPPLSLHIR